MEREPQGRRPRPCPGQGKPNATGLALRVAVIERQAKWKRARSGEGAARGPKQAVPIPCRYPEANSGLFLGAEHLNLTQENEDFGRRANWGGPHEPYLDRLH